MPLLAIDTSAAISVAVLDGDGALLGERFSDSTRLHAEMLTPMIQELLVELGLTTADLTAIAVGTGPGPFTGLRIGLVTAETLAYALGIPVYGVCSLDALAASAATAWQLPYLSEIIATSDARRKEVYWARYSAELPNIGARDLPASQFPVQQTPPQVSQPEVVSAQAEIAPGGFWHFVNNFPEEPLPVVKVVGFAGEEPKLVQAAWVGRLALLRAAGGIEQPTTPLYLRRPDIQGQAPQPM